MSAINQAQAIQNFLVTAAQSRGGTLPADEVQPLTDWCNDILDSIHCINLVLNGDADAAWDTENNEPVFALTSQGFDKADPDLREKAIHKNAVN